MAARHDGVPGKHRFMDLAKYMILIFTAIGPLREACLIDRSGVKCLSHLGLELARSVGHEASLIPANPKSYAHMNDIIKHTKRTIIKRV